MKNPGLDRLHGKLDKCIRLVESYTEIKELAFVLKAGRFKPYSYMFEKRNENIVLYDWWFDEFGNSLRLNKKKIDIIYNDLSLDRTKIVCSDLYYGLSINKISKISKCAYICLGKDEDLCQDFVLVTFLGIDNYFRSFMYMYEEWLPVSSLLMGLDILKLIGKNAGIKYFQKFPFKKNSSIPCIAEERWLTCLPVHQDFIDLVAKDNEVISFIVK